MSLRNVLKYRSFIYVFLGVWIVLFHIFRRYGLPTEIPVLTPFLSFGNMAVDVFMFFSGCCIFLSFDRNPKDIKGYYTKRAVALLIPYILIALPYWIWRSIASGASIFSFLANISSAAFWLRGTQTTWFVFAIALCYVLFPLIYKVICKSIKLALALLAITVVFNIAAYMLVPVYLNSAIAWTRIPIFMIGCIAGKYIDKIDMKNLSLPWRIGFVGGAAVILGITVFIAPINAYVETPILWLLYAPMTLLLVLILMAVFRGTPKENKATDIVGLLGGSTLELYLVHIAMLNILDFYGNIYIYIYIWGIGRISWFPCAQWLSPLRHQGCARKSDCRYSIKEAAKHECLGKKQNPNSIRGRTMQAVSSEGHFGRFSKYRREHG